MDSAKSLKPSSSTEGFFIEQPILLNQFHEDKSIQKILSFYFPHNQSKTIASELDAFGNRVVSPDILKLTADAELNPPSLRTWDSFGRRKDELIPSEGWRKLQEIGIREGIVAIAYENKLGPYSRLHQFLKYHLWTGSCAYVTCPSAMTDGAARVLSGHLASPSLSADQRSVFSSAYNRLTSRDPEYAWTSGQWMTERQGGSDVSNTETIAIPAPSSLANSKSVDGNELGPWSISGFKWFSSATDANMAILLARTPDGKISTFFAPMRRTVPASISPSPSSSQSPSTELNGVSIQKLKSKLGTKALPTAELVLTNMRAHLIGTSGAGVREIATILNITRVHTAVTVMGLWGRGLAISRAFARVRVVGGKKLMDLPAHVKTMSKNEVEYRGYMHLTYFTALLLGISEQDPSLPTQNQQQQNNNSLLAKISPTHKEAILLLRILTPVLKASTAKSGILALSEATESLGGLGYIETEEMAFNTARLLRDIQVLSIWEGTTDVLALDMLKVLKGRQGGLVMETLEGWIDRACWLEMGMGGLKVRFRKWKGVVEGAGIDELKVYGRDVLVEIARIVGGVLLKLVALGDVSVVSEEVYRRWNDGPQLALGLKMKMKMKSGDDKAWMEEVALDRKIVFGDEEGSSVSSKL